MDPTTGELRWFWRDEAYLRVGGVLTDGGATVVLALDFQGEAADRDKVVALDTGTGRVRWQRYDDELVAAMATLAVAGPEGDWYMVPAQAGDGGDAGAPGSSCGRSPAPTGRSVAGVPEGVCSFLSVNGVADVALVGQQCPHEESTMTCELRAWSRPLDRCGGPGRRS